MHVYSTLTQSNIYYLANLNLFISSQNVTIILHSYIYIYKTTFFSTNIIILGWIRYKKLSF